MDDESVSARRAERAVAEAVDNAVTDAGPDEAVRSASRVAGGTNAVYRVETSDDAYFVKFNTFSGVEIFATEVELYRLLADTDLPIPRVFDAVLDRAEGPAYAVLEALPGESPEEVTPGLAREMGATLRSFASIPPIDGYGRLQRDAERSPPLVTRQDTWPGYIRWYAEVQLSEPADGLTDLVPAVRSVIDETIEAVPREPDPAVVFDDFRPPNIHVDSDGAIVGVFDLERTAVGDLRQALVNTGYLLARHPTTDRPDQVRSALSAGFGTDVDGDRRDCYRALAVAREIRAFDIWWDDDVADERADDVRRFVAELTE